MQLDLPGINIDYNQNDYNKSENQRSHIGKKHSYSSLTTTSVFDKKNNKRFFYF